MSVLRRVNMRKKRMISTCSMCIVYKTNNETGTTQRTKGLMWIESRRRTQNECCKEERAVVSEIRSFSGSFNV